MLELPQIVPLEYPGGLTLQTRYAGKLFRSRTEARWAVFFETLHVHWEYEPEGFRLKGGPYLPDFFVLPWRTFFEIKPWIAAGDFAKDTARVRELSEATGAACYVIYGPPDLMHGSIIFDSSGLHCASYLDAGGPATEAPYEGAAYLAYMKAMQERFTARPRF